MIRIISFPRSVLKHCAWCCSVSLGVFSFDSKRINALEYFTDARVPAWHRNKSVGPNLRYISLTSRYIVYHAGLKRRFTRRSANVSYAIRERFWSKEIQSQSIFALLRATSVVTLDRKASRWLLNAMSGETICRCIQFTGTVKMARQSLEIKN